MRHQIAKGLFGPFLELPARGGRIKEKTVMRRKFAARMRSRAGSLFAVCLASAAVLPQLAGTMAAGAADKVTIGLTGMIGQTCIVTGAGSSATRQLRINDIKSGVFQFGYDIECNTPFKYSVESANGALTLGGRPSYTVNAGGKLPYMLAVRIPTDDVLIEDLCTSESIKAGQVTCLFHDSRNGVAINGHATLTMHWQQPGNALAAGSFSDRLTFTVGIRQ